MNPTDHPDRGSLAGALDAIATGAARTHALGAAPDGGLAVTDIRAAARRRRTRFEAGVGLAAAAVVGALVLGGATLSRADRPVPPVDSPTPTDVSVTGGCGQVLDDLVQPAGGPDVEVSVEPRADEFRSGDPLSAVVKVTVAGAGADDAFGHMTALALARDGVIVGVASGSLELGPQSDADTAQRQAGLATVTFTGCGADGEPADSLAAGDYDLVAIVSGVMLADGGTWAAPFVSNPAPVRVLVSDEPAGFELPACGEPTRALVASAVSGSVTVTAQAQVRVGVVDEANEFVHQGYGDTLAVDALLANNGPDLYGALGLQMELVVARDGSVVAALHGDHTDPPPEDWSAGGARGSELVVAAQGCDGAVLPPGDYVLWLRVSTNAADTPDGETTPLWLIAQPVPFHIYAVDDPENYGPISYLADGEAGWADVTTATIPGDLPFLQTDLDRVIRSQAYESGSRWRVTVAYGGGRDTYANARAALVAAGFAVVREETDPEREFWDYGQFEREGLLVVLDVSNETGGGFYGDFLVVRTG